MATLVPQAITVPCPACGYAIPVPYTLQTPRLRTVKPGVFELEVVADAKPIEAHVEVCPGPPDDGGREPLEAAS